MSFFKGAFGGDETSGDKSASGNQFMSNASSFFSSVQAKSDGLVSNLTDKFSAISSDISSKGKPANKHTDEGGDSSASEYGDEGDDPMYADEAPLERRLSAESIDSLREEEANKFRGDINQFVMAILKSADKNIVAKNDSIFENYISHHTGRSAFARELRKQTEEMKEVSKNVLEMLFKYCGIALSQCDKTDDFAPAYILLNVAFRIFEQSINASGKVVQCYLYTGLRNQTIWQSTRFWNAAIFLALQLDRSTRPTKIPVAAENDLDAEKELQDGITYSQLSKFAWRMYSLGLNKEACMDFLRKQATDAGLSKEKQKSLRANVNRFYSE